MMPAERMRHIKSASMIDLIAAREQRRVLLKQRLEAHEERALVLVEHIAVERVDIRRANLHVHVRCVWRVRHDAIR